MSEVKSGYCEDDNLVFISYAEGDINISTHLTNKEVDELVVGLRKAKKQVRVGTTERPN